MSTTVIVFQENCILAAMGKEGSYPALFQVKRIGLTGTEDSFSRWSKGLSELNPEWQRDPVHLVLPAGMSSTRMLSVPWGRGKQLADMAKHELANSFRNEIADYSVADADKKGGVGLCAGGADAGVLEDFAAMCEEIGFSVGRITVPMEGYLRLLKCFQRYSQETAVYLFLEDGGMTSILCQNGKYLYSSRSRLFSEPGTLDFGTEIVRSISGILQFYAGSRRESQITKIYYAGCPEEDFEVSLEGIRELGLETIPFQLERKNDLPPKTKPDEWLPCIGAMIREGRNTKQIDLYAAILKTREKEQVSTHIRKRLAVPGFLLGAGLLATLVLLIMNWNLERKIQTIQNWTENPKIQSQYEEAQALEARLAAIEGGIAAVTQMEQNLASYPSLSSENLNWIERVGGDGMELQISGYDAQTGILTFRASSREVIDVSAYILKMQQTGIFHTIDYTGYAFENDRYILSLSCTLEGNKTEGGNQ